MQPDPLKPIIAGAVAVAVLIIVAGLATGTLSVFHAVVLFVAVVPCVFCLFDQS